MHSIKRHPCAENKSPPIGSSLASAIVFNGWFKAIGGTQPSGEKCGAADESEESPVLATVDHTFWSDSDITALRTQEIRLTQPSLDVGEELPESQLSLVVSVLPAILGCPLPPSCFSWYLKNCCTSKC